MSTAPDSKATSTAQPSRRPAPANAGDKATEKAPAERSGDKTIERNDDFVQPAENGTL